MTWGEGIKCYHCGKGFYLHHFRFTDAKTVSCLFCGKRIVKLKAESYDGYDTPPKASGCESPKGDGLKSGLSQVAESHHDMLSGVMQTKVGTSHGPQTPAGKGVQKFKEGKT